MATQAKAKKYNWRLELNGFIAGRAQSVQVPDIARDNAPYSVGGDEPLVKEPMRKKIDGKLVIKHLIFTGDGALYNWFMNPEKRLAFVYLLDDLGKTIRKYECKGCFPDKINLEELDAKNENEFVMETAEFSVDDVVLKSR